MNPQDQELFDRVTSLDINSMTANDKAVLRARRDYLTGQQKEYFKEVLEETPAEEPAQKEVKVVKEEPVKETPAEELDLDAELTDK